MPRKRYVIESINELLGNKVGLVYSRHRPVHNFMMNIRLTFFAYHFFGGKPDALVSVCQKDKAV